MATSTCPVARDRSCLAFSCFQKERVLLPLRALSGSTIRFAGWIRYREWAEHQVFRGHPKVPACRAGTWWFRAQRRALVTVRKVLRDPTRMWSCVRCVHGRCRPLMASSMVRGCFEATKAPRQSDRRDPVPGGNVGDGAPTEVGEVGHSLSVRRWSSATSLKTSVSALGKPRKEVLAYPTDRILGGEVSGRQGPSTGLRAVARRVVEFPVATPGVLARRSWSREEFFRSSRSRSITSVVAGGFLPLAYWPSTSFACGRRVRWVSGAPGCLHPGVS